MPKLTAGQMRAIVRGPYQYLLICAANRCAWGDLMHRLMIFLLFASCFTGTVPAFAQPTQATTPPNQRLYATITDDGGVSHSFFFQETSRTGANIAGQITVRTRLAGVQTRDELLYFSAVCRHQPNAPPHVKYSRQESDEPQAVVTFDSETLKSADAIREPLQLWLAVCYESQLTERAHLPEQLSRDKPRQSAEVEKPLASRESPSVKLAALPKDNDLKAFNGTWAINWTNTTGCKIPGGTYTITIANGAVTGIRKSGSIAATGVISWRSINHSGNPVAYRGKFSARSGSGSFRNLEKEHCSGVFTAARSQP
jgi:hypothetical protein